MDEIIDLGDFFIPEIDNENHKIKFDVVSKVIATVSMLAIAPQKGDPVCF